jgi:uncharacterized lipoprotein
MTPRSLKSIVLLATILGLAACGIERRQDRREDRREDRQDLISQGAPSGATVVAAVTGPTRR